ncbi:pyrroloquinoline quinone biosynthesis protein PqqE [candidate division WWE3 bacterium CG08_land_8_20_14_0_20_43_13]|uniref:7-carboxy-7-deazaguanine synthase n=2 Tax=Bacteria candidate phyla TaxID=1783234 RepID=A0A2H0X7U4_UNCKA|nr:MAG: pyrroloquinoline quinone biosynthesis protein PqqE [candidate division WWE3 bacterium CG08_land_8_20_14_0_20_43_13]PJE73244.1 MAG: pyrroloquinoline quinone biosynthesis protein PqqE [Candidatus Tagabacteria bacterium CG10_big_fil_rev_8_21_14_0_10_40_13]
MVNKAALSNTLRVSGDLEFATLQGEGDSIGKPAVFLRLQMCNLKCKWCDTKYSWDQSTDEYWNGFQDWTYKKAANRVEMSWQDCFHTSPNKRLVITGGEPLLQQKGIEELVKLLPEYIVEIETNGTVAPNLNLSRKCQFNISPKLESSNNPLELRYKPEILKEFNKLKQSWFKFVVVSLEDFKEIDKIVYECDLRQNKIIIMPEGVTNEEVTKKLRIIHKEVCSRGWRLLPRFHLQLFGAKRRT